MKNNYKLLAVMIMSVFAINGMAQSAYREPQLSLMNALSNETVEAVSKRQAYPPGIMFSTLLNNFTLSSRDGRFHLSNQMQNVFMPKEAKGRAVLSRAEGSEIGHWNWVRDDSINLRPPYALFGFAQPQKPNGTTIDYGDMNLTEPGNYVMDFFMGEKRIYTFPFSISKVEPANPFDGNTLYFLDGAWNDWGYLIYPDLDPSQNLLWKIWLREKSHARPEHKILIEIVRDRDRKLICKNRSEATHRFQKEWVRYNFDMVNPPVKTSGGAYFKAKDLLAVDGGYTLTMKIDGAVYGIWKFTVSGGKLNYTGNTVRGTADPLTFVEGGKDAFWYKRES